VYELLVPCIKEARKRRQVVLVTHNPNLTVVCDADQIIHRSIDKGQGNKASIPTQGLKISGVGQSPSDRAYGEGRLYSCIVLVFRKSIEDPSD
jgi:hypothetical protein